MSWRIAKQQFIAQGTIPGMGHGCRSPDKVVRNCQRPLAAKQQFIVLFIGEISCIFQRTYTLHRKSHPLSKVAFVHFILRSKVAVFREVR
jgi:hypothetical protein